MQQYMIKQMAKNIPVGVIINIKTVVAEVTDLRLEDDSVSSSVSSLESSVTLSSLLISPTRSSSSAVDYPSFASSVYYGVSSVSSSEF